MPEPLKEILRSKAKEKSEAAVEQSLIDQLLKSGGDLVDLANRLHCTPKQVQNAIARLRKKGYQIKEPPRGGGRHLTLDRRAEPSGKTHKHRFEGRCTKIGIISDPHYGSLWERPDIVNALYDQFRKENVDVVYMAGDLLEGGGRRKGQEYEQVAIGFSAQVAHVAELYPKISGVKTKFICGDHDYWWMLHAGAHVGEVLPTLRDDMIFLDWSAAEVSLGSRNGTALMVLEHPGGGTAYAISYRMQKRIEAMPGGEKPNILVLGHYHKAMLLPQYRNVHALLAGCCEDQSKWMRERALEAMRGGWILEVWVEKGGGVARLRAEWLPIYV